MNEWMKQQEDKVFKRYVWKNTDEHNDLSHLAKCFYVHPAG